jgi:hypothetical protein
LGDRYRGNHNSHCGGIFLYYFFCKKAMS